MKTYLTISLFLLSFLSLTYAVSDENICDVECQYCCREKVCQSEQTCKGNMEPFIILGAVAGSIVALLILRKLYLMYRQKHPNKPKDAVGNKQRSSRRRAKPAKAEKSSSKARQKEPKAQAKTKSKEEVYLEIENDSVVALEIKPDQQQPEQDETKKTTSMIEVKPKSKTELLNKGKESSKENDKNKKKSDNKENNVAARSKTPPPKSGTQKNGANNKQPAKKPLAPGSSKGAKPSTSGGNAQKERGRSANSDNKERSGSQKKNGATGGNVNERSKGAKK